MSEPLVSILIPAYNAEEWISESIKSAISQTWKRKEVIVIDDGSSDATLSVADRFAGREVRVVRQSNQGAAAARNLAYSLCRGDYVQWLDADDLLEPDKIERQLQIVREGLSPRTLLSGAWAYFHYRKRKAIFSPSPLWSDLTPVEWLICKMSGGLHMQTDNWLVSRELTEAAGPWDVSLWRDNDGEYFCRVLLASNGVRFVREAKSYYRTAGFTSISYTGGSHRKLESLCRSIKLHIHYLLSIEDSERTREASIDYVLTWLAEFYPHRLDLAEELKSVAVALGGLAAAPRLSKKYRWLVNLFGWNLSLITQNHVSRAKHTARISWDKAMYLMEQRLDSPR